MLISLLNIFILGNVRIETINAIQVINEIIKVATIFPSSFQAPMNYTPVDIFNKEKIKRYWVHFTSTLQFESKVFFEATLNSIMHNK